MRPTTEIQAAIEHAVLTSEAGVALLDEVAAVKEPRPADLQRWRERHAPEFVAATLRLAEGRRKGAAKFSRADRMWFEPTALEQATAEAVSAHKAARFRGAPVLDFCCGIGGDAISLASEASAVLAVDRDRGMLRRLAWNCAAYGVADRVLAIRGQAEAVPIPGHARVHIDPDRRAGAVRRSLRLEGYRPDLTFLRALPGLCRGGAIKLGPASDFAEYFGGAGFEVEVISLRGECKEATVWFGDLATCRRRATALPSGATWTDTGRDVNPGGPRALDAWLVEPDPALVRSGLAASFADAHGLARLSDRSELRTAPGPIGSPLVTNFAVEAEVSGDLRRLRSELAARGIAPREIKARGPGAARSDEAARALRGLEGRPATVFLVPAARGGGSRAIVAHRRPQPGL